jgi:microcystin-dependent protein
MSQQYIGEIRAFGFSFATTNWAFCDGQLLPINQYNALYTLIGTTYGGDGAQTFAVPNLQGRAVIQQGQGPGLSRYVTGEAVGTPNVTLTTQQIPSHTHMVSSFETATAAQRSTVPGPAYFPGPSTPAEGYIGTGAANAPFSAKAITSAGSSQPHENQQPLLVMNFCIALYGVFPSQN